MLLDQTGRPIREGCTLAFDKKLSGDPGMLVGQVTEVMAGSLDPSAPTRKTIVVMVPYTFHLPISAVQAPGVFVVGSDADQPQNSGPSLVTQ